MKQKLLILTLTAGIAGAIDAADIWTYNDCVEYARTHNISLQKMRLNEETATVNLEESEAQWQPSLDFSISQGVTNYPWNEGSKTLYNSSYGLNAGWTVWNGGQRENTIKRNRLNTEIARLNTDDAMQTIETNLLQVYINILYARESIGIYEEAAALSGAQADRARQLMEAGRLSRVDYAQLQSQHEQDLYSVVNARGQYDTRRMELKKILELGIDNNIELAEVDWTADRILATLPPIEESYRLSIDNDLTIQGLAMQQEGADIDVNIAKAAGRPRLSLNASVGTGYSAPGQSFGTAIKRSFNETAGLTLSIPILDNKKTRTAVARARVQQLDARLDIDQRQTELAQLVENWYIDTRSAQSRYSAAEQQLKSAELTAELTNEQFTLGLVNTIELMTAHNNLVEARRSVLQAKYMAMLGQKMIEYYRTSTVSID